MIVKPDRVGTHLVSSAVRKSFAATWHGTVIDDSGRTGALAFNLMSNRYMSVIGANDIVQLDNDQVNEAMAQALTPIVKVKGPMGRPKGPAKPPKEVKPLGRQAMYGERMSAYPVNITPAQASLCKTLGDGNLAAGVRLCIDAFLMQSAT